MNIEERIRQVDLAVESATVSLSKLHVRELFVAKRLCEEFELPLGTLVRRANAIKIAGFDGSGTDRLREAAQHLIY